MGRNKCLEESRPEIHHAEKMVRSALLQVCCLGLLAILTLSFRSAKPQRDGSLSVRVMVTEDWDVGCTFLQQNVWFWCVQMFSHYRQVKVLNPLCVDHRNYCPSVLP